MGIPTIAAYVLAAVAGGPALIKMGGELLSVHLFVFCFAILAFVTSQVTLAAYAGDSLAKTDSLKTGFETSKLVLAGYLIPYLMLYNPVFMLQGSWSDILISFALALFTITFLALAVEGYSLVGTLTLSERILYFTACIIFSFPSFSTGWHHLFYSSIILQFLSSNSASANKGRAGHF